MSNQGTSLGGEAARSHQRDSSPYLSTTTTIYSAYSSSYSSPLPSPPLWRSRARRDPWRIFDRRIRSSVGTTPARKQRRRPRRRRARDGERGAREREGRMEVVLVWGRWRGEEEWVKDSLQRKNCRGGGHGLRPSRLVGEVRARRAGEKPKARGDNAVEMESWKYPVDQRDLSLNYCGLFISLSSCCDLLLSKCGGYSCSMTNRFATEETIQEITRGTLDSWQRILWLVELDLFSSWTPVH